ncbi:hypothetical protein PS833_00731 [Pseudomonas fluorescens]|uniref:Uncharacterized protein n=1 Tax=Pseudomonas fluorescens TaxID=294 RepID=A0A5E7AAA8_PSEFL|nr:hypothetical protein PS833_00731 [Pseudomonas fluorescens]
MPTRRSFVHQLIRDEPMTFFSSWPLIRCQPRLAQSLVWPLIRGRTVTSREKWKPRFLSAPLVRNEQLGGFARLLCLLQGEQHFAARLRAALLSARSGRPAGPCRSQPRQPTAQARPSRPACTALLPVLQALVPPPWPNQALSFLSLTWGIAPCSRLAFKAARMRSRTNAFG